ncbi:FkbM family methyltransferase [Wolinella succinogenes]|uniref:FkbM family methyltransferase n=1 Tax=Wolinella succinogenes TaxID=844 RepID=UPI002409DE00|nr:FkbM family methyltransferase [Wolinella succinogenes]
MQKYVPIEELVEKEKLDYLVGLENNPFLTTKVNVRDVECIYHTNSKRTLWQAVGVELIEPEMLDFLDSLEEDAVFYDIGASNGIFSIYAMQKGLRVFAFEPEIQNFSLLGINSYLNSKTIKHQPKIFNIALSDSNEMGSMFIAKFEAGGHMKILDKPQKVGENDNFTPDFVQNILKYSLDEVINKYKLPNPEYIKIDVDGAELAVINGGGNTLTNKSLKSIFIELEDEKPESEIIINRLQLYGFSLKSKTQVQNYVGLYNYIFRRNSNE